MTFNILMVLIFKVNKVWSMSMKDIVFGHFNFLRLIKLSHHQWKKLSWSSPNTILEKIAPQKKCKLILVDLNL